VVYVVGSSHSGSTLLALLGAQHPLVASVGEASVKPRIRRAGEAGSQQCSCGARLDGCPFWKAIFRQVSQEATRFDASYWSNDYRFEHPWVDRLLTRETSADSLRHMRRWAARHVPGYRQRVARIDRVNVAFIRAVLSETDRSVFLDTTKLLTRLTHLLDIADLGVKIVWLTRDPRGVAWSARRRGVPIEHAAQVWRNDQASIFRDLAARERGSTLQIRYEDLCREPVRTLNVLWNFCGVPPIEPSMTLSPAHQHVLGNSMRFNNTLEIRLDEQWTTGLADGEQQRVLSIAGPMLRCAGYD
jgi:hypothetical protein